ncbi:MAG: putative DNA binding domain-containing protein [Bacteroidales bacterium]|nr:putative DNA binding domain-containing protein [Lentimicrobiaceae bacterium]MDD5694213.1 putative DNA binding domain-containing protein [Bacteroidales bacterium]
MTKDITGSMKEMDVLKHQSAKDIAVLIPLLQRAAYRAGQYIYFENDPGGSLYFILEGEVAIELSGRQIRKYGPGESFGEVAFIDESIRTGSARAVTDVELAILHGSDLYDPAKVNPFIAMNLQRSLAAKVVAYLRSTLMTTTRYLLMQGEGERLEFKSTLRMNLHTGKFDKEIEHAVLKTLAAFLNTEGGTLLVGVDDRGQIVGLEADQFPNHDRMLLHLTKLVSDRISMNHMSFISCYPDSVDQKELLRIDVSPADIPAYLEHNGEERFYIRTGPSTIHLRISELYDYLRKRFYRVIS